MKRIFAGAFAILLLAGAAQAQVTEKTGKKYEAHQKKGEAGLKDLNLTADQKAKLKTLHEQEKAEADALKNSKLTIEEHKAKRKELHEKYMAQMKAILTPEQQQKMAARHDQMGKNAGKHDELRKRGEAMRSQENPRDTLHARGHYNQGMKNRDGVKGKEIADELNLTADQKVKVKNIRQEYKSKLEAVRNDNSLSQDQKRAKFQEVMKAQQDAMKSVLTPDQIQKMESLRQQRGDRKVKK
jgi:Spy/CpxP family protein refolding chaperone